MQMWSIRVSMWVSSIGVRCFLGRKYLVACIAYVCIALPGLTCTAYVSSMVFLATYNMHCLLTPLLLYRVCINCFLFVVFCCFHVRTTCTCIIVSFHVLQITIVYCTCIFVHWCFSQTEAVMYEHTFDRCCLADCRSTFEISQGVNSFDYHESLNLIGKRFDRYFILW